MKGEVNMMEFEAWIKKAESLEKQANIFRQYAERTKWATENIGVGTLIKDLDTDIVMKVSRLKNGSNDFEARSIDGKIERGYHYIVTNWEVV